MVDSFLIRVSVDVKCRLDYMKVHPRQSYDEVLKVLLDSYDVNGGCLGVAMPRIISKVPVLTPTVLWPKIDEVVIPDDCLFKGVKPGTVMNLACPCALCSPRCDL